MRQQSSVEPVAVAARVPLARAAAAQAASALLVLASMVFLPEVMSNEGVMTWAVLQGIVAASLGRAMGMEIWWLPIHAAFAPGLVWMLALGLPPVYALVAFCMLVSVFWGVSRTRVPLFLSSRAAARAVAKLLPRDRGFSFLDLGCGLGGVLTRLARECPAGRYHGIESAPVPFLLSRLRTALGPRSCRILWGDFNKLDLGGYDVVYAYLSPAAMSELWRKARREMRAGSLLISNSFSIPGVPPTLSVPTGATGDARLLLWRI